MKTKTLIVISALALASPHSALGNDVQIEKRIVELEAAKSVEVIIQIPVCELDLSSGAEALLEADFEYQSAEWVPVIDYQVDAGRGVLSISTPNGEGWDFDGDGESFKMSWDSDENHNEWDLKLSGDVPLTLVLKTGVIDGNLDLRGLRLEGLNIEAGVGDLDIDLPCNWMRHIEASIEVGVGDLELKLPGNIGLAVVAESGIGQMNIDGLSRIEGEEEAEPKGFNIPFLGLEFKPKKGGWFSQHFGASGVWTNEAYGKADTSLRLRVEVGVGELDVEVED